jgi:hypothetical protein
VQRHLARLLGTIAEDVEAPGGDVVTIHALPT